LKNVGKETLLGQTLAILRAGRKKATFSINRSNVRKSGGGFRSLDKRTPTYAGYLGAPPQTPPGGMIPPGPLNFEQTGVQGNYSPAGRV
jgi:hypothetical protein